MLDKDYRVLINGELLAAPGGDTMEVVNPANGRVAAVVPKCRPSVVDGAVAAARKAGPDWAYMATSERGKLLVRLARLILENKDELAKLETAHYGGPIWKTGNVDIPGGAGQLEYIAGVARAKTGDTLPVGSTFFSSG